MALFSFFSSPRSPRQFEHKPIYWDPQKEKTEEREQRIKRELGIEEEDLTKYKSSIKGSFSQGTTHLKKSLDRGDDERYRTSKNVKLAATLIILALVFWILYLK